MIGWIGIDPGATGAIAVVREDLEIDIYDFPGDERKLAQVMRGIYLDIDPVLAFLEYQQSMPKQGTSSTFKLGVNYGMWLYALAADNIPVQIVRPAIWKKGLGYPAKDPNTKEYSMTLARRLYPKAAGMLTRVKDHGRAEALLLAYCARKTWRREI